MRQDALKTEPRHYQAMVNYGNFLLERPPDIEEAKAPPQSMGKELDTGGGWRTGELAYKADLDVDGQDETDLVHNYIVAKTGDFRQAEEMYKYAL
jgi:hypothetical protein